MGRYQHHQSDGGNVDCTNLDVPIRFCQDTKCKSYGTKLIEILNQCHLLFVNGRVPGDLLGRNGSSCIDLSICSI